MIEAKVNFAQIEEANKAMKNLKLGNKEYAPVNERIKAFRKVYPYGSIETEIEIQDEKKIQIKASIYDGDVLLAIGRANEENRGKGINALRMVENCETSAIGRALGFCGFGVDTAIASAEDIENSKESTKTYEIAKGVYIPIATAIYQTKLSVGELMKKMGVIKAELNDKVDEELWTNLEDMTLNQLLRLEEKLKTLNCEENTWHELYNNNTKIKDVVPKNQQVIYKSSWVRFGEIALEMAGTDELKRQAIIEQYQDMEIDLGVSYE